jgi:hypothetical protein
MSNRMLLRGITHVVITTAPTAEKSKATGIIMTAEICFGPDVSNAIGNIDLIPMPDKTTSWRLPSVTYTKDGKPAHNPVFRGSLAEEIGRWAATALDRIKKEIGNPKWGKIYSIPTGNASKVEEIVKGVKGSQVPA